MAVRTSEGGYREISADRIDRVGVARTIVQKPQHILGSMARDLASPKRYVGFLVPIIIDGNMRRRWIHDEHQSLHTSSLRAQSSHERHLGVPSCAAPCSSLLSRRRRPEKAPRKRSAGDTELAMPRRSEQNDGALSGGRYAYVRRRGACENARRRRDTKVGHGSKRSTSSRTTR